MTDGVTYEGLTMEQAGASEVEVISYLLHEQSEESHQYDVEEERWFLELGERVAFKLAYSEPGSASRFLINDIWPFLYRTEPAFREAVEAATNRTSPP